MPRSMFVMAQTATKPEWEENLKTAERMTAEAVEKFGADFMVFPEVFSSHYPIGTPREIKLASGQPLDGPFVTGMRELAREKKVWMAFGMAEKVGDDPSDDRNYNTTVMLDDSGGIVQVYRKTHLYDAFGAKESDAIKPGDKFFEPVDTPFGKVGMFVCYEVRFPEVARYQTKKGAEIILMPTAWARGDLKSLHFRTLITARAIENTVYMLACDEISAGFMGESVAVDPMGVPIAAAGETETLVPVCTDTERVAEVRRKLPSYKDRRPELYVN